MINRSYSERNSRLVNTAQLHTYTEADSVFLYKHVNEPVKAAGVCSAKGSENEMYDR